MDHIDAAFAVPIAHRGLHSAADGRIENSREAFDAAISYGFAIECDLQLTGDDEPVVFHDYELDRLTAQKGKLRALSADQLCRIPLKNGATPPQTFAQFLDHIKGRVPLIVELKPQYENNAAMAQKVVAQSKNYKGPLVFKSFDPQLLNALHKAKCQHPIGIVLERARPKGVSWLQALFLRHLWHLPYSRFQFISCNVADLDMWPIVILQKLGMKTMSWTIRTTDQHERAKIYADQIVFEGEVAKKLMAQNRG